MKRYGIIIAVGLALVAGAAWAQPQVEWERNYNYLQDDICNSLAKTSDGGYVLAGITRPIYRDPADFWIVKTDSRGGSIWSKTFGGPRNDVCNKIVQTQDNGYVACGSTYSFGEGSSDFWLLKIDANGDSLWSRTYGQSYGDNCNAMIITADGGFALAGSRSYLVSNDPPDPPVYSVNACLIKTDPNGEVVWLREFCTSEFVSLTQTNDGGYALVGNGGDGITIMKVDANGDSLWGCQFEVDDFNNGYDIVEIRDGGLAVAGSEGHGEQEYNMLFVKVSPDGEFLWSRNYGGAGHTEVCRSIKQTNEGGFVLAGYSYSFGAAHNNGWLLRTNSMGDSLWSLPLGGHGDDYITSIEYTPDQCFILAGVTNINGNITGYGNYYLVKTTPDPVSVRDPSPLTPYILHLSPAFPNPFNSTTRIGFDLGPINRGATKLEVFDPLGRRMAELIPASSGTLNLREGRHEAVWDARGFPAGEYLVRLQAGSSVQTTGVQLVK